MQRTLITEQADGTFQCTVTLTADELPEFLKAVRRPSDMPEKPAPIRLSVSGIDTSAVLSGGGPLPREVTTMIAHSRFQAFASGVLGPAPATEDVREFLGARIADKGPEAWPGLLDAYEKWHEDLFPSQNPYPV